MKLIIFLGIIIISWIISFIVIRNQLKRTNNIRSSFFLGLITNLITLGFGSIWWFFTETDGISQITGMFFYGISFMVINIVNFFVITVTNKSA